MPLPYSTQSVHIYIIGRDDGPMMLFISKYQNLGQATPDVPGCPGMRWRNYEGTFPRAMARQIKQHTHQILAEKHVKSELKGEWFDVTADRAFTAIGEAVALAQAVEPLPPVKVKRPVKAKRLTIDVDPDIHMKMKLKATNEGVAVADIARRLFQEWADKQE